jgi:hypothetical protein
MLQHLEASWSQNRVRPDAIQLLDMLSDEMPDEGEIEEFGEDLNDLQAQVREVIRRIHESSLPAEMMLELLRIAQELKDALTNIQITGPLFLRKTVVQVNATLEEMWHGLGVYQKDESVSLFKSVMIKAAKLAPYVERLGRAADTGMRFLDSADRVRKLVSGEPPTA